MATTTNVEKNRIVGNGTPPAKTRSEAGNREKLVREVHLAGLTEIMFDRYPGDNDTKLDAHQKSYLGGESGRLLCLPTENIMSFLSSSNTDSAPKRLLDKRKYKEFTMACSSYVMIAALPSGIELSGSRLMIPFLRHGQPIEFGKFVNDHDELSGCYIDRRVARLKDGIPNPKVRPALPMPWELHFQVTLLPNKIVQEQQLKWIFEEGMLCLGLGTFRGRFGKSEVTLWQ
jgi:hypothetical protein